METVRALKRGVKEARGCGVGNQRGKNHHETFSHLRVCTLWSSSKERKHLRIHTTPCPGVPCLQGSASWDSGKAAARHLEPGRAQDGKVFTSTHVHPGLSLRPAWGSTLHSDGVPQSTDHPGTRGGHLYAPQQRGDQQTGSRRTRLVLSLSSARAQVRPARRASVLTHVHTPSSTVWGN